MYCKNCGAQMNDNAAFCVNCGAAAGQGTGYCANCGNEVAPGAAVCLKCGVAVNNAAIPNANGAAKSKIAAGLLGDVYKRQVCCWRWRFVWSLSGASGSEAPPGRCFAQ